MRVPIQPIKFTGSWVLFYQKLGFNLPEVGFYFTGSWEEVTALNIVIFINTKTKTNKTFRYIFYSIINQMGFKNLSNFGSRYIDATLTSKMVEPVWAVYVGIYVAASHRPIVYKCSTYNYRS